MRIATYNFLCGGSARRSSHWEMCRQHLAPEILLAQECRPPPLGSAWQGLWARVPRRVWGSGVYLARGRIEPIPVRGFHGWVVGGEVRGLVRVGGRRLRVFSIHCNAGQGGYVKTMARILDRLAGLAVGADLVLGGDFNVAVGHRRDGDRIGMSAGERSLLDRLAGEFGLIPCWQTMHPGAPLAQTLRWTGNRALPYHCDGIFVPASWRHRLESAEVIAGPLWEQLSDHNPVVVRAR